MKANCLFMSEGNKLWGDNGGVLVFWQSSESRTFTRHLDNKKNNCSFLHCQMF